MDILIVKRRNNGWMAFFQSKIGTWEFGNTQVEAIGKLILSIADNTIPIPVGFYRDKGIGKPSLDSRRNTVRQFPHVRRKDTCKGEPR